jgi:histidine triad (HIT) family protein
MASIFSKIIDREIPAHVVAETDQFLAFLDVNPVSKGHTLVIPKKETDYIFDMDNEEYAALMLFAKLVAQAIKKVVPCTKVGIAVIGLEVPHAHVHLVPMNQVSDMNFSGPRVKMTPEEYTSLAAEIRAAF